MDSKFAMLQNFYLHHCK